MVKSNVGGIILLLLCAVFFFVGGLGYRQVVVQDMGVIAGILLTLIVWFQNNRKLLLPPFFWVYIGFAALIGWDVMTRGNSFYSPKFFSLMMGGGFFWLAFFNIAKGKYFEIVHKYLPILLTVLGYVFFVIYLWFMRSPHDLQYFSYGFLLPLTQEHWHIGVYWSLLLIALFPNLPKNNKYRWYFVFTLIIGMYMVIISQARSAYLAIMVGALVYFQDELSLFHMKHKNIKLLVFTLLASMMIITINKPIRSFNFYTPAMLNLERMPLGIGVGRFKEVTSFYSYKYESTDYITTSSHNIFLEMLSGLGWMGLIFFTWFILSSKILFQKLLGGNIYSAMFFAITAIFLVDPGYSIPTLYWLWMSYLGIAQASNVLKIE